jgi:hypothetical protein
MTNIIDARALFAARSTGSPNIEEAAARIAETVRTWDVAATNRKFNAIRPQAAEEMIAQMDFDGGCR